MDKVQAINPARIAWCCEQAGLSFDGLARATKIAPATLQRVMDGEDGLSVTQLGRIAAVCDRGLLFFLEPDPVDDRTLHSAQFRTLSNQKPTLSPRLKALVERVERQRALYLSLLEDMDEAPDATWFPDHLKLTAEQPEQAARQVREWLGLGASADGRVDFRQYREAVEAKGVMVLVSNGYQGQWQIAKDSPIRGFSLYFDRLPVIVIKKQGTDGPQAFTLMHELAHLLLHRESVIDDEDDFHSYQGKEKQANAFAGHLLVPDTWLKRIDLNGLAGDDVAVYDAHLRDQARAWCVSVEVILRRLMDSDRLSAAQYHAYRQWKQKLPIPEPQSGGMRYRHSEPVKMFGQAYVGTVLDALHGNLITLAKASTYLDNLKIKDLRRLEETHARL